ncbi:hypothetical protein E3O45_16390 [Cryobacterium sp. TMS1-20-1]|uniref:hypothetical protein n=1 Tax=Cryobacterium sp. TMS1-20-1 TaxID=1259223 RepID=UPI00106AF91B|nr:hypothetical protein [Cryobacterium sp. TMS1-20-1]TFC70139.1 hypothetical protein E3O45_16390 [Cryobacterium sp. TMS1-20-1]
MHPSNWLASIGRRRGAVEEPTQEADPNRRAKVVVFSAWKRSAADRPPDRCKAVPRIVSYEFFKEPRQIAGQYGTQIVIPKIVVISEARGLLEKCGLDVWKPSVKLTEQSMDKCESFQRVEHNNVCTVATQQEFAETRHSPFNGKIDIKL